MSIHLTNISTLRQIILENDYSLERVSYRVTKEEYEDLEKEIKDLSCSIANNLQKKNPLTFPPYFINSLSVYEGITIVVGEK